MGTIGLYDTWKSCEKEIVRLFLEKIGQENSSWQWVGKEGTSLLVDCVCVDMWTMTQVVCLDVSQDEFYEWWDYHKMADKITGLPEMDIEDWHKGAIRLSQDEMDHLCELADKKVDMELAAREASNDARKASKDLDDARSFYLSKEGAFPSCGWRQA